MILIIDFGSQTTHLIGRKIRDLGVATTICDPENAIVNIKKSKPAGLIFSGGPASVYTSNAPFIDPKILNLKIPILGICYGWQLIAHLIGGKVVPGKKEYSPALLKISKQNLILNSNKPLTVWMGQGDTVQQIPQGFSIIGSSKNDKAVFVGHETKKIYGVQFHPEIEHTQLGQEFLKGFVTNVCGLTTSAKTHFDIKDAVQKIKDTVGDKKVICAVSGGVDSTVAALLIQKAVGKNLYPIHINSGLNRAGTTELINKIFLKTYGVKPIVVNAKKEFLKRLKGVTDAEKKRKIIGKLYINLFVEQAEKIKDVEFLGQGTIYSDVVESIGAKNSAKIKSHHNVGGLPKNLKLKLIEPLRYLYKDEVKEIGLQLGVPEEFVFQQKFPGPGYAIRIMGEVTAERLKKVEKADRIVIEEMRNNRLYDKVFHSFAIMTGAYSTALKGDAREFDEVVAIRVLEATEEMTANWAHVPHAVLGKISSRIVNEVPNVSRVVYDITTKPPSTMEWE